MKATIQHRRKPNPNRHRSDEELHEIFLEYVEDEDGQTLRHAMARHIMKCKKTGNKLALMSKLSQLLGVRFPKPKSERGYSERFVT